MEYMREAGYWDKDPGTNLNVYKYSPSVLRAMWNMYVCMQYIYIYIVSKVGEDGAGKQETEMKGFNRHTGEDRYNIELTELGVTAQPDGIPFIKAI